MFIFRRSIAGPVVALTFLAVLVVADAQVDASSTPGTKASDVPSRRQTAVGRKLEPANEGRRNYLIWLWGVTESNRRPAD